jgi:hypothetical protein
MRPDVEASASLGARTASMSGAYGIDLGGGLSMATLLAWAAVCIPIAWGVWKTLESTVKIFQ